MPLPNIFHGVAEAFSKTTKITFRVSDLEKVNYNVGETIKGHIFLASASPLHIASLDVCLSGREEVHEAAKKTNHPAQALNLSGLRQVTVASAQLRFQA